MDDWDVICEHATNGEIAEAIECLLAAENEMDEVVIQLLNSINIGENSTLKELLIKWFESSPELSERLAEQMEDRVWS